MNFPGFPSGSTRPLMRPDGRGTSGILVMAEALGEHEEKDQLPLRPYAEAGSLFERALFRAGIARDSLTITNLVWYRPPRNWLEGAPWETDAIQACKHLNDELIAKVKPKVILALGGLAFRELTGMCGDKQGIGMTRGFIVPSIQYREPDVPWAPTPDPGGPTVYQLPNGSPIPVIGTYHPSFLRRGSKERAKDEPQAKTVSAGGGTQGMNLLGVLIRDLQLAQDIARNGPPKFCYHDYKLGASLDDWRSALAHLRANPQLPIAYDFETRDSLKADDESEMEIVIREVTQVQISWMIGQALVSPWTPDLLPILRDVLQLPNLKIDWNGRKFDRPIARNMGIRTDLGTWEDLMDLWHHAQPDLPRGLQFATSFFCPEVGPWKHLSGSDPLIYGAYDVDMPLRIRAGLELSLKLTREPHSGVSLWSGYQDQVVKLAPVLDRMSARGIPVDEPKRLALDREFTATLARINSELQLLHPDELKNLDPKNGYVRAPEELWVECAFCDGTKSIPLVGKNGKPKKTKCPSCQGKGKLELFEALPESGLIQREFTAEVKCGCIWSKRAGLRDEDLAGSNCDKCNNTGRVTERVTRWCRLEPFLTGWQQVLKYCKWQKDREALEHPKRKPLWEIPTDYKTGRETTEEKGLARLAKSTGDPLLPKVLEHREIAKARGTYVLGWAPGPDGCVHPNFGFKPATPQLSSDSPNAQNFPQHAEISHVMKQMISARPGKIMVKFDWKSFFIITGGFEAQDDQFIRIGRVDMHSFVTLTSLLRLERPEVAFAWGTDEMKSRLSWWRKQPTLYPTYARAGFPSGMTFGQIRDYIAKRVIFAWQNGQGPRALYMLWQETFRDIAEAASAQAGLAVLFPKTPKWQTSVRLKADTDHKLITRFGHVRHFWDVYSRKIVAANFQPNRDQLIVEDRQGRRWLLRSGDDHEAVTAYLPNSNAYGIKREVLVKLGELGWDEKYGLHADVHDALYFECDSNHEDSLIADVKPLMEAPNPKLIDPIAAPQGLWCGVEGERGPNWDEMKKLSI